MVTENKKETTKNVKILGDLISRKLQYIVLSSKFFLTLILIIILSLTIPDFKIKLKGEEICPIKTPLFLYDDFCQKLDIKKTTNWSSIVKMEKTDMILNVRIRGIRKEGIIEKHEFKINYISKIIEKYILEKVTKFQNKEEKNKDEEQKNENNENLNENEINDNLSPTMNSENDQFIPPWSKNDSQQDFLEEDSFDMICNENKKECEFSDLLILDDIKFSNYRIFVDLNLDKNLKNYFDFFEFEIEKTNSKKKQIQSY